MWAAGNRQPRNLALRGFTLLELLVVVAIVAVASVGVSWALRDSASTRLEEEAQRLAMLLEAGRAQSRLRGVAVRWLPTPEGFRFEGLARGVIPEVWLSRETQVQGTPHLNLGPDPIIPAQEVTLSSAASPNSRWTVSSDGLKPFMAQSSARPVAP